MCLCWRSEADTVIILRVCLFRATQGFFVTMALVVLSASLHLGFDNLRFRR